MNEEEVVSAFLMMFDFMEEFELWDTEARL